MSKTHSRRDFLRATAAVAGGGIVAPHWSSTRTMADEAKSPNERWRVGAVGVRGRGQGIANQTKRYGDVVAVADVDRNVRESRNAGLSGGRAELYEDYRVLLDRSDIDVVTIGTPDHWHSKMLIDAMKAGKDVYCEKPLTLTIEEGKLIGKVARETKCVVQVGTQQRSEYDLRFLKAVAMVRDGRIGQVRRVTCAIGGAPAGGPFQKTAPPDHLNWDMWLGQAPSVEYIPQRCHHDFRWWYEYSGGKMTDWGAHHVDIAQWAIGMEHGGPTSIEMVAAEHPVELKHGRPTADDRYNTATAFRVRCEFPSGVELFIRHDAEDLGFDNGILFEGDEGRFFVNRGRLTGAPVEDLKDNPISEDLLVALRNGKPLEGHMANFHACARDRSLPVSDVFSHHRSLTTCHLANIALRLGRNLRWDAQTEQITGDAEANAMQSREQRTGYAIDA